MTATFQILAKEFICGFMSRLLEIFFAAGLLLTISFVGLLLAHILRPVWQPLLSLFSFAL